MKDFPDRPLVADEAPLAWCGVAWRLSPSVEAGGATILEATAQPGFGPPRHAILDSAVTLVVTEGALELWTETAFRRLEAGETATVPAGVTHAFRAAGRSPSRHLHVVATPGLASFLRDLGRLPRAGEPRTMRDRARPHGIEIRGPMLGAY